MGRAVVASAPGKIILMGEHAAVYGCPAVSAALGLRCQVTLAPRAEADVLLELPDLKQTIICSWGELIDYALDARRRWTAYADHPTPQTFAHLRGADPAHLAKTVLGESAMRLARDRPGGIALRLQSAIPMEAGFGSSAALAVSLAGAVLAIEGSAPSVQQIGDIAFETERRQHGQPSGVDHNTALLGGAVIVTRAGAGAPQVQALSARPGILDRCSVYHTGAAAEPTGAVVTAVRRYFNAEHRGLFDSMERATCDLLALLDDARQIAPDQIIPIVRRYESFLEQIGVVPAGVRQAIRAVEQAGGAAKICGAGSLAGPGAGALLVVWPGQPPDPLPAMLTRFRRIAAPLAAAGLSVEIA